jgi:predicted DNA-binding transcriptional regulator AlpA
MPQKIDELYIMVDNLIRLLLNKNNESQLDNKKFIDIHAAAKLLDLSVATVYSKNSRGELPGVCKRGGKLYFLQQTLIDFIESGRKKSNEEIKADALNSLSVNKKA